MTMPIDHNRNPSIAVVGARGLVGQEALSILAQRGWRAERVRVFGSPRSVGTWIAYGGEQLCIEPIGSIAQDPPDYALLCADTHTALDCEALLREHGTTVIDNSSAFRMHNEVPLVIPGVNGHMLNDRPRLIANPNCSTIMLLTALNPLRAACGIRGLQASTYQAVSGAGRLGLETLREQTRAASKGGPIPDGVFPVPCAFDVFEHESTLDPQSGFNGEESKMIAESRKIWDEPGLSVLPTCVRVPVERAHAQAITLDLGRTCTPDSVLELLRAAPGVAVWSGNRPLTPASISGRDDVFVGRVRVDPCDGRRVLLWVCCDQIRKGAALNAVQIMDRLMTLHQRTEHLQAADSRA
jgi:aspartate-semialdehyde dehydrogenase